MLYSSPQNRVQTTLRSASASRTAGTPNNRYSLRETGGGHPAAGHQQGLVLRRLFCHRQRWLRPPDRRHPAGDRPGAAQGREDPTAWPRRHAGGRLGALGLRRRHRAHLRARGALLLRPREPLGERRPRRAHPVRAPRRAVTPRGRCPACRLPAAETRGRPNPPQSDVVSRCGRIAGWLRQRPLAGHLAAAARPAQRSRALPSRLLFEDPAVDVTCVVERLRVVEEESDLARR